ncbi:MAG TPA: AraC family transcriptional regulator ligand-binding domain-containing protein [Sphingopyxis sp.]|nr:AraC family transcriptional regulator ligand-binding domain-containing protein [Sphingopyxis sp.]
MGDMVTSLLLEGAGELLVSLGGDPAEIAAQAGIPLAALSRADVPVLGAAVTDFYAQAAKATECRNFGLMMAQRSSLAVVGNVWLLLSTAPTIGQMVEDLVVNFSLYSEGAIIALDHGVAGALMSFDGRAGRSASQLQMMEFALAICCEEMRRHCPPDWQPTMIQFRHKAPADTALHRQIFGPNLMFDQDGNMIFMDADTLAQERKNNAFGCRMSAQKQLLAMRGAMRPQLAVQVEGVIRSGGAITCRSATDAAKILGLAQRTMQRRLADEGTSFNTIVDAVRADLALKYVEQSALTLGQIAELLGYSEQSAFTRAFRRWHGGTAMSFRKG